MTNHERKEGQPTKQEKEEQKGKAPTTFLEILRRLQELAKKIALSVQEETEQKTLSKRQGELIAEFRGTNFGRKTEVKRQGIGGTLEKVLNEFEGAKGVSDEEFRGKEQAANEAREKASEEAQKHWEKEEQTGVKEEHKGIAKHLLEEVTGRAEEKQRAIIKERKEEERKARERARPHRRDTGSSRRNNERVAFCDNLLANGVIDKNAYEQAVEAIREGRKVELKNVGGIEGNDIEIEPTRLGALPYSRRFFDNEEREKIRADRKERDRLFNNIFRSANRRPDAPFEQSFNMYSDALALDEFFDTVQDIKDIGPQELQRYIALTQLRRLFHNANFFVSIRNRDIEGFVGYMKQFDSRLADYIFKDERVLGLTEVAYHFLEQSLEKIKSDNEGTMPPEKFVVRAGQERSEWDEMARKWLEGCIEMRLLRDKNGEVIESLEDWEIENALRMAKGWGIVTKRFLEIVASARKPTELPNEGRFRRKSLEEVDLGAVKGRRSVSYWGEGILRVLNPHEHLIGSFNIGDEVMAMLLYKIAGRPRPIWNWDELKRNMEAYAMGKMTKGALLETLNLFKIGGAFTSGWRRDIVTSMIEGKDREHIGYGIRYLLAEDDAQTRLLSNEETREQIKKMSKDELDDLIKKEAVKIRREIWGEIIQNDPLKIVWILEDRWMREERIGMTPKERLLRGVLTIDEKDRSEQTMQRLDKARDEIERNLILAQEARVQARGEHNLDYYLNKIEDEEQKKAVRKYVKAIREEFNNCEAKDKEGKVLKGAAAFATMAPPYSFSTEDVAFREFEFDRAGAQGFIARRFSDFEAAWTATNALGMLLEHLPDYHEPSDMIKQLITIKEGIDAYDPGTGKEVVRKLAEGIIRFYDQEWWSKLPVVGPILSPLLGRVWKEPSYAQHLYGMGAMSLDESDKNNFINHLRLNGLIDEKRAEELKKRVGARPWFLAYDYLRSAVPLGLLFLVYSFMSTLFAEVTEEAKSA